VVVKEEAETFTLFERCNLEIGQGHWIKTKDLLLSSAEEYDTEELHIGFTHIKTKRALYLHKCSKSPMVPNNNSVFSAFFC